MNETARLRAFLAVPPDPGWAESARGFLSEVRPALPEASWTRPESWHLTLKFLGEVSREVLAGFATAVGRAALRMAALSLPTRGSVVFPPRGPARVLGVGFDLQGEAAALAALAQEAEQVGRTLGLPAEQRPFHPHVTFARLRLPWPAGAVARFRQAADAWAFPTWPVRSCVLYESRLSSEGAVHTPVDRWAFAAPGEASA
jgi:2'-5' RNA ligase